MPLNISSELIADDLFRRTYLAADSAISSGLHTITTTTNTANPKIPIPSPDFDYPKIYIETWHPLTYFHNQEFILRQGPGEEIQHQIQDEVEQKVVISPLNPGGDSAIRKLL